MAAIISASIDVSKLPKEKFVKGKKGVWYNFTISVNDDTKYGNNVSLSDSQTKEEREAGKPRDYLGNGKVIWTNGSIAKAESEAQPVATTTGSVEDLF
jgi:hypothetical protein